MKKKEKKKILKKLKRVSEIYQNPKSVDRKRKTIAVDFDGTLCEDRYPEIGAARQEVIERFKAEKADGSVMILWTCRVGAKLQSAVEWCEKQGVFFDYINENDPKTIERFGGDSRKIYCDENWDDKNFFV
jgi:hypothetical protein